MVTVISFTVKIGFLRSGHSFYVFMSVNVDFFQSLQGFNSNYNYYGN